MEFSTYRLLNLWNVQQLFIFLLEAVVLFIAIRSIWRLYFHPLSSYPGPKIAAVSDIWWGYHSVLGRWPWVAENALKQYGDVVRVAPNELVFVTPQALADIYGSHNKNLELFHKTQIGNYGNDKHGGLIWEWDPVRHRQVAKQLSPAFSGRALKAKEPALHSYIDQFVERMKTHGGVAEGVNIPTWISWLCVDVAADMAYNRQMNAMKDMRDPPYLSLLTELNQVLGVIQVSERFPFLSPLKYLFLASTSMKNHSHMRKYSRQQVEQRIKRKGAVEHLDFFEQVVPADRELPKDPLEMRHLEQVAGQLLAAGFEPPSSWLYHTIFYLVKNPEALRILAHDIRGAFKSYNDITPAAAANLPYLTACLKETLRMMPSAATGMPVISPGAVVDGTFVPKGVVCQSSMYALARKPHNFHRSLDFHPERWLPEEHSLYDSRFANDNRRGHQPFGQGPRACPGKEIGWWQCRLFIAKVLWTFDLEMVSGQEVDLERDMRGWGTYIRPDFFVRFTSAKQ